MAEGFVFGTGGTPRSTHGKTTVAGIERIRELGLGALEIEFVQGVKMTPKGAAPVKETAARLGVRLSAHGPYAINLNSLEPEKVEASRERILKTARTSQLCGARDAIFHAAFYMGQAPEEVYPKVKKHLQELAAVLRAEGVGVTLRPEVMGKGSQFGTIDEVLRLSKEVKGVLPGIDVSHWHARTGGAFNTYEEFIEVLRLVEKRLGRKGIEDMHFHVSGIAYTKAGERKHLNLKESDFNYVDFLRALKDMKASGLIICESPNLEDDATLLQETYARLG